MPSMTDVATTPAIAAEDERYNATLIRRETQHESLAYFWVKFDDEPTPFEPGQYMTIGVFVDGKIVQRPYSVASAPSAAGDSGYEFYLRLVQGGTFTPLLWDLPVGHRMRMIGPKGKFGLGRVVELGADRDLDDTRPEHDVVRLQFVEEQHLHRGDLENFLREHLGSLNGK